MQVYREKQQTVRVVTQVLCNCCGKPAVHEYLDNADVHWSCHVTVVHRNHGPWPDQFSKTTEYDICEECFDRLFKPLVILPSNEVTTEEGRVTVTP